MQVGIREAKTQLSQLIAAAERGEEVIITRRNKPVVRLQAIKIYEGRTRIGGLKGRLMRMGAGFNDPKLNADIAQPFAAK